MLLSSPFTPWFVDVVFEVAAEDVPEDEAMFLDEMSDVVFVSVSEVCEPEKVPDVTVSTSAAV